MTLNRNGLPIAAYLGMLVALALASAFVAVVAIVIWLPPRPPDVVPADVVAHHFEAGYEHMTDEGRAISGDGMEWTVQAQAPRLKADDTSLHTRVTALQLAGALQLRPDQVRLNASHVERSDVFVVRVGDMERDIENQVEREVARVSQRLALLEERRARIHRRQLNDDDSAVEVEIDPHLDEEIERATRELRVFEMEFPETPAAAPQPPQPPTPPESVVPVPPVPPVPTLPRVPIFAPSGVPLISGFEVAAQLADGRWLVMRQGRNWAEIGWIGRAALVIGGTLTVLSLLAVLFARRLTRPIRNFSDAVQAVGVDPQNEPVREEGPQELRGAARAVNTMQARIRALIADRTKTLAAVAHDMRTPLMRLRLQAENAPADLRDKMGKEIEEVEALVAGFIAFARDDPAEEARVRLDLTALLQSIADDRAEARQDVAFGGEERVVVTGQSLGLKRLFSNLVDNALKYGASARIKLRRDDGRVLVDIEDDGPGIPAAQRETVFEPFVRLSDGASGAGLGLAAARSIARAHGGDIVILDGEKGALLRVTLPG